jgi:hypothetical protein
VFSRTILGFIMSKEGKVMDPKKVVAFANMPILTTHRRSKFLMKWPNFISASSKTCFSHVSLSCSKSLKSLNGLKTDSEEIKNLYIQAPILIGSTWELEFHIHMNDSQLVIGAILA